MGELLPHRLPLVVLALSFLVGSIPFGLLIGRIFHVDDIRKHGSGNIGATNVSRVAGFFPAGLLTFTLDLLKGALPVLLASRPAIASWLEGLAGGSFEFGIVQVWLTGFFAVLGHCFSPWLHFRGGKGVATGFGAILVLSPLAAIAGALGYAATFVDTRTGSLASLTAILVVAVTHLVLNPLGEQLWIGAAILLLIVLRHEKNIDALLDRSENTF